MGINKQSARIKHHTSTTSGSFTVPSSEDFTDGTWDKWDLAKSEIAVNEADDTVSVRVGSNIRTIYPQGASTGVFGISDSSGVYTYYSTIALANAGASSGDTIVFFANVTETGTTEFILKDGVNYNLNGYTYENSNAGTNDAVTDNNVAVTCTIFNGTIKRSVAAASLGSSLAIHVDNASSVLTLQGVNVINTIGVASRVDGHIKGGYFDSPYYACYITGTAENVNSYSLSSRAIYCSNANLFNCFGYSDGSYGIETGGTTNTYNCTGYSSASVGFLNASSGESINCNGISDGSYGYAANSATATVTGCMGSSTSNWGIRGAADLQNCSGFSNANYGGLVYKRAFNCTFESTASDAVYVDTGEIYNCSCICSWNNSGGDAAYLAGAGYVFNCFLHVTNNGAYCINGSASTSFYGENVYKGATTPVNTTTITQGQTNTPDTYGNILIG